MAADSPRSSVNFIVGHGKRIGVKMSVALKVLLVEDSFDDAELLRFVLKSAPFEVDLVHVQTEAEFVEQVQARPPDVVLCDYHLPRFSYSRALHLLKERQLITPLLVVSNNIGEDAAVAALQEGAADYLLKGRLGRLAKAIEVAIAQARARSERIAAENALRHSEVQKRGILDSLDTQVALLSESAQILAVNKAWLAYDELSLRFEGRTCGVGENYFAYLNEIALRYAHIPQMLTGATEVLSGTRDAFSLEFPIDVDGHIRWYLMRALPIGGGASGIVVAHEDITDRMLAHIALQEANNRLRLLSQRVLTVQEEERRYISRELHDDLGQTLTALKINLHLLGALPPADVPMKLADCTLVAEGALEKLRQMSSDLHPPQLDQLGLEDALRYLADRQAIQTGVQVNCENGDLKERLPKAVELALFRIAQEAISNAARHAKASQISLRIERQGDLVMLRINDDGEGFDPATARQSALKKGSLGLISMEERAQLAGGRLQLRSVKGLGTVITATIPLATIPGDASATVNKGGG